MSFTLLAERIVCINLRERNDRYEMCKKRFAEVGLKEDDVQFLRVQRHPKGGRYGCYDSHRTVLQQAYDDGLNSVLIFEDDVEFREGWDKQVTEAKEFLDSGMKYDALMLGPELKFVDEKPFPNVWRVKCIHAHAYVVSREGMRGFIERSELFEAQISEFPQDVIQNSAWQHLYAHISKSIGQDNNLGTDLIWLPDIPVAYTPWFQNVLCPAYDKLLQPLIRCSWWRHTWLGSRYMLALDHCIIDDGRVRLVGFWQLDAAVMVGIMLMHKPPFGYLTLFRDFLKMFGPSIIRRAKMDRSEHGAPKKLD